MAAPLHSRFRRNADRDLKTLRLFKKHHSLTTIFRPFKTKAQVYTISPEALDEAAALSLMSPRDLIEVCRSIELPSDRVWVEFDHRHIQKAVSGVENYDDTAVRSAYLFTRDPGSGLVMAAVYNVFATGKTMFVPLICAYDIGDELTADHQMSVPALEAAFKVNGADMRNYGIGFSYSSMWSDQQPRLIKELAKRCDMIPLSSAAANWEIERALVWDTHGTARIGLALLALACVASGRRYVRTGDGEVRDVRGASYTPTDPYEVDLYIKPHLVPGQTLLRGLRSYAKKRRHEVRGHWRYFRKGRENAEKCATGIGGRHVWEKIEGTSSQVCLLCEQKRYFVHPHERGEGTLKPKPTYNVKV